MSSHSSQKQWSVAFGTEYLVFLSSKQEKNIQTETTYSLSQFFISFVESVFTFQFFNDKIHNFVKKSIWHFHHSTIEK